MVALGQRKICGGKFRRGDRSDIDPEPIEQRKRVFQEQLSAPSVAVNLRSVETRHPCLSLKKVNSRCGNYLIDRPNYPATAGQIKTQVVFKTAAHQHASLPQTAIGMG